MKRRKAIKLNRSDRFIADTHFGHMLMAVHRDRLVPRGTDHDTCLIESWNSVVGPTDTVWHVGDFVFDGMRFEDAKDIFSGLNGRKHLIVGNHDQPHIEKLDWEGVHFGPVHWLDADSGLKIVGSHHPQREWDSWWRGALHFHGHTHNNLPSSRRSMDVGVDSIGPFPLTFAEIHQRMLLLPELDFTGVPTEPFDVQAFPKVKP